jgi:hypothetical protein
MVFVFKNPLSIAFKPSPMMIGLEVVMIVTPQVATAFFLVITLSFGVAGNNKRLPGRS